MTRLTHYSYYLFDKLEHTKFPALETKYVSKVLDYVDRFPADSSQCRHRFVSYLEKQEFVHEQVLKDSIKPERIFIDTLKSSDTTNMEDNGRIVPIRRSIKRARLASN